MWRNSPTHEALSISAMQYVGIFDITYVVSKQMDPASYKVHWKLTLWSSTLYIEYHKVGISEDFPRSLIM